MQMGQVSSFFRVFLSTLSKVSRKEDGRPRFGDADVNEGGKAASSCSEVTKLIKGYNGMVSIGA